MGRKKLHHSRRKQLNVSLDSNLFLSLIDFKIRHKKTIRMIVSEAIMEYLESHNESYDMEPVDDKDLF